MAAMNESLRVSRTLEWVERPAIREKESSIQFILSEETSGLDIASHNHNT